MGVHEWVQPAIRASQITATDQSHDSGRRGEGVLSKQVFPNPTKHQKHGKKQVICKWSYCLLEWTSSHHRHGIKWSDPHCYCCLTSTVGQLDITWSEYKTDLCIGNIRNLDWAEWSVSHVLKDSELLWQNNCQVLDRTSGCACLKDMITCVFRHQAEHLYFIPAPEARLSWALEDEASTIVSAISARHSALYCLALTPVTQLRWTSLPPWQFLEPFTQTHPWVFCDGE